jgi:hypothetical protein
VLLADIKTVVKWLFYFIGLFLVNAEFEVEDWQIRHDTDTWIAALRQDKEIIAYFKEELQDFQRRLTDLGGSVESHITRVIGTESIENL